MISLKASTPLLRTATTSWVATAASFAAIVELARAAVAAEGTGGAAAQAA